MKIAKKFTKKPTKKPAKATKPAKKATVAKKGKKPAKAEKSTTTAKPAKVEEPTPSTEAPAVTLPAHFTTPGGCEFDITPKAVTVREGLREVIFKPEAAHKVMSDMDEIDGQKLPEPIPAGTVVLVRGEVVRLVPHDYADIVAAIMEARREAIAAKKTAKAKGGAE